MSGGGNRRHTTIIDSNAAVFDRNSPRPPVPGEERSHCVSDWGLPMSDCHPKPRKDYYSCGDGRSEGVGGKGDGRSPEHEPSPPACLRWATSLHRLLEDPDGVELFKRYLQAEGRPHADALDFWFACEGLRKQAEPSRVQQLVKVIYKRFFLKSALPISEDLKRDVGRRVKACMSSVIPTNTLFDDAQAQVEDLINVSTYPNFIKSDVYLQYIQSLHNPDFTSSESSSSQACATAPLPIIHEDEEFASLPQQPHLHTPGTGCLSTGYQTPNMSGGGPVRLTKDLLLATQRNRAMDVRPKPEAYAADMFMYRGHHLAYNSYNPVSRQDSEMQSLSSHSDARTESDNMSLTDSSVDGRYKAKRKAVIEARHARESAALNRETHMTLIPRTQRVDKQQCQPLHPDQFAAILIQKLETVRREQDVQETLERKLRESDSMSSLGIDRSRSEAHGRELANAIREKLQLEDDNDQDILDQHVSRVFSDLTPGTRSPGVVSPRAHSPRRYGRRRRDRDGFSTFSSDSGNVHDYVEGDMKMIKSKSMPEYEDRFVRGCTSRRSSSKKTLTDFTDSGVSVVSDTPPVAHSSQPKDHRVLAWLLESDRGARPAVNYTHSELSSSKHRGHRSSSATSPNAGRHRSNKAYGGSRSSSLERSSTSSGQFVVPAAADSSMPPPQPSTAVQLEEARRRLMEDEFRRGSRQRSSSSKHYPEVTQSSQSTLRKASRGSRQVVEDFTTVVFSFCEEQFPYRTKIPGRQITLKQFKEYLPKKGNYRYFFKTECEELDNQVIQEEVSNDSDILPLWEGRVNAQVKPID